MTLEGRFTFKHESAAPPTAEQATPNTPFVSEPSSSMATPPTSYSSHGFQQQQHNNFMSFPKKEFACSPTGGGGGSGSGGPSSSGGLTDFYQPPAGSTFQAFGPPPPSSGNDFCEPSPGSGRSMYDHTDASGGHHVPPPPTSLAHPLALSTMRSIRRGHFTNQQNSSQELSRYVINYWNCTIPQTVFFGRFYFKYLLIKILVYDHNCKLLHILQHFHFGTSKMLVVIFD